MFIRIIALALLVLVSGNIEAQYKRSPQRMTLEEIQNERYGIRQHKNQINLMSKTGDAIRDGACSDYWDTAKQAKIELEKIPSGLRNYSYRDKRAKFAEENRSQLVLYRQCFTAQLPKYPSVYADELDPARSYAEFIAVHGKLSGKMNDMQVRFYDLGQELKTRGQG